MIGRDEFAQIKPGACLVNVANAPIINREALIEALRAGRLGGVGARHSLSGAGRRTTTSCCRSTT